MKIYIFNTDKLEFNDTNAENYYDDIYNKLGYAKKIDAIECVVSCKKSRIVSVLNCLVSNYEGCVYSVFDGRGKLIVGGIFDPINIEDFIEENNTK